MVTLRWREKKVAGKRGQPVIPLKTSRASLTPTPPFETSGATFSALPLRAAPLLRSVYRFSCASRPEPRQAKIQGRADWDCGSECRRAYADLAVLVAMALVEAMLLHLTLLPSPLCGNCHIRQVEISLTIIYAKTLTRTNTLGGCHDIKSICGSRFLR